MGAISMSLVKAVEVLFLAACSRYLPVGREVGGWVGGWVGRYVHELGQGGASPLLGRVLQVLVWREKGGWVGGWMGGWVRGVRMYVDERLHPPTHPPIPIRTEEDEGEEDYIHPPTHPPTYLPRRMKERSILEVMKKSELLSSTPWLDQLRRRLEWVGGWVGGWVDEMR